MRQMDKRIDDLSVDVREIRSDVGSIKEVLIRNTETLRYNTDNLAEHMRRTEILEQQMEIALTPIKFIKVASKVVVGLGAIYGALKAMGLL